MKKLLMIGLSTLMLSTASYGFFIIEAPMVSAIYGVLSCAVEGRPLINKSVTIPTYSGGEITIPRQVVAPASCVGLMPIVAVKGLKGFFAPKEDDDLFDIFLSGVIGILALDSGDGRVSLAKIDLNNTSEDKVLAKKYNENLDDIKTALLDSRAVIEQRVKKNEITLEEFPVESRIEFIKQGEDYGLDLDLLVFSMNHLASAEVFSQE